ncbi:MAG: ComEC/Rec2 family competence protein [Patescibacteria group bacterium]
MRLRRLTQSKAKFFLSCQAALILGILIGNFFSFSHFLIFLGALFSVLGLIFCFSNTYLRLVFLLLIFCLLGFWRYQVALPDFSNPQQIYFYNGSQPELTGRLANIDRRIDKQKMTLIVESVSAGGQRVPVSGKVLITTGLYPQYTYGEVLRVGCRLESPGTINDFDYGKYLSSYNIYSLCWPQEIQKAGFSSNYLVRANSLLLKVGDRLSSGLSRSLGEPQNAFLQALILNRREGLSQEWLARFSQTGITHIIAVSGSHIAIIASLLSVLAISLGISRQKSFWFSLVIIILYVLMIGSPASAVRSAVMGIMVLYAQKIGRLSQATNLIFFSASAILLVNPLVLLNDIGFQLSFLAVIGLIHFSPLLMSLFQKIPDPWRLKEMFILTLAAQLTTLPLIIFYFHKLSLVSFLANILLLPVVPFLMVWGFINSLVAVFSLALGQLAGYISWLVASYFLVITDGLSRLPFAALEINYLSWPFLALLYFLLIIFYYKIKKKHYEI